MRVWAVLLMLLPSYTMLIIELYYTYDPDNPKRDDYAKIAFFMRRAASFGMVYYSFLALMCTFENNVISGERCAAFEKLKPEVGYKELKKEEAIFLNPKKNKKKAIKLLKWRNRHNYFGHGRIEFRGVTARYPTSVRPVLKDINLMIEPGQKIGIVGRTGAGKSSFIKLIWRALLPKKGKILIDGLDINMLDLKSFREQLTVILQKPNLFEGTLASNISSEKLPLEKLREIRAELLELGFPREKLKDGKLGYKVETGGSNLSQSEKQIVCLMQSLQKDSKIVILDEATAYVDVQMEKKFQEKMKQKFERSTLLVIAHRVSNVVDCDRILVFDQGEIVQDGNVKELVEQKDGAFYQIWKNR
jgi:ABC-type multidrug transport system fused ATPase/permease subunit